MSKDSFENFGDIVSKVLSNKKDPIQHLLVLTYEFDEQQLVNLVCSRNLEEDFELRQTQLKILSDLRPVVIYDARKTKAFSKLPQFLELHPFKTSGFSCHHSKAYLIITEKSVRLVLGSFNLTMTGLFRNREVFEDFYWDARQTNHLGILNEWTTFLQMHYQGRLKMSSQSALSDIIDTLGTRYKTWNDDRSDDSMNLFYSGYDNNTGLKELHKQWNMWFPDTEPESLIAVSPFFDESPQNESLASDLHKEFPAIHSMTLITDQSARETLSKAHFGSFTRNELLLIPTELSQQEHDRIERQARKDSNSTKDQRFVRNLHAKIMILQSGSNALLYIGSANFSRKAWQGNNQELGVIWKEQDTANLRTSLIEHLCAATENQYSLLPILPPPKIAEEDDEGYNENTNFPDFIEMILLTPNQDQSQVQFRFEMGNRQDGKEYLTVQDYVVQWAGIQLKIENHLSQWVDRQDFQNRLLCGRNISFQLANDPTQVFWFPFQYEGNLIAERETFLHPSSWDWMAFYLNSNQSSSFDPGEYLPGDENESNEHEISEFDEISREKNCVIAMQGYLSVFTKVERDFYKRLNDLDAVTPECRLQTLKVQVIEPLNGFCNLLEREAKDALNKSCSKEIATADIFKMGELYLLVNMMTEKTSLDLRIAFQPLRSKIQFILNGWNGGNNLQIDYLNFVIHMEAS